MSAFRYDFVRAPDDSSRSFRGVLAVNTFYPTAEISSDRKGTRFLAQLSFRAFELRPPNDQLSVGEPWSASLSITAVEDVTNVPGCGSGLGVFTINFPNVPSSALQNGIFFFGKAAVQYVVTSNQRIVMNGLLQVQTSRRFPRGPFVPECAAGNDGTNGGNF